MSARAGFPENLPFLARTPSLYLSADFPAKAVRDRHLGIQDTREAVKNEVSDISPRDPWERIRAMRLVRLTRIPPRKWRSWMISWCNLDPDTPVQNRIRQGTSAIMPPASCHTQTTEGHMAVTRIPIPAWARIQKADDRLDLSLSEIDLIVRTVNCLEEQGIFTVRDLLNRTPQQLLEIPNFGVKTLETVYVALEKIGFYRASRQPVEEPAQGFALLRE
jgi:DNA-directed RNA polymerase subunit alpha